MSRQQVIVITGPTASGKSALAVAIARQIGAEIISADSRQLYREIPIVTAAPTIKEQGGIRHHFIGTLGVEDSWSAAKFEQEALKVIGKLHEEGKRAVVCGGSMLYVDALRHGIDELPDVPPHLRENLKHEWKRYGDSRLRIRLLGLDPDYYARVDLDNMKRVFHAVEMSLVAGQTYSSMLTGAKRDREFDLLTICLDWPRELLYERINRRVDMMLEQGLLEEARKVWPFSGLNSLNTVGLKELFAHFEGKSTLEEAVASIKKNTRVYAKKQITWYKKDADIMHVDATNPDLLRHVSGLIKR